MKMNTLKRSPFSLKIKSNFFSFARDGRERSPRLCLDKQNFDGAQKIFFAKKRFLMRHPRPLFVYFRLFHKQTLQILQLVNEKKCPTCLCYSDSNPRPPEQESTPVTTRPVLLPMSLNFF